MSPPRQKRPRPYARVLKDGRLQIVFEAGTRIALSADHAAEMLQMTAPPALRAPARVVPVPLRALIVKLTDAGIPASTIAAALRQSGARGARGGTWWPATIRSIIRQERKRDERARRSEWHVLDS